MKHASAAVVVQLAVGLALGNWVLGGAFMVGFFVGVEWMQQIRQNDDAGNSSWPAALSAREILMGFIWRDPDRYKDAGLPLVACLLIAFFANS